jgi:4-carboxymuconolactone decarboxylase
MKQRPATPRIAPLQPPYDDDVGEMLRRWMPPGVAVEPLALFRTMAVNPELMSRARPLGAGILGHGRIAAREREIVILRTCARAGAEYEWGVHAAAFGAATGLTPEQIAATAADPPDAPGWSAADAALLGLADELHDSAAVSDELWSELAARYDQAQLMELLTIAGWYRLLAYIINGLGIPLEAWAPRFPPV